MSFFPLPYRCTIKRKIEGSAARSGQKVVTYDLMAIKKCLFLETAGNRHMIGKEQFEATEVFYLEPYSDIRPGDLIVDIKDKSGKIIEAGPLEVVSAKNVPGLSGRIHHISCKLKGSS